MALQQWHAELATEELSLGLRPRALSDGALRELGAAEAEAEVGPTLPGLRIVARRTFFELAESDGSDCGECSASTAAPSDEASDAGSWQASTASWAEASEPLGCSYAAPPGIFALPPSDRPAANPVAEDASSQGQGARRGARRRHRAGAWQQAQRVLDDTVEAAASSERTTLLLKNTPLSWNSETLAEALDGIGLHGAYDFLYVPVKLGCFEAFGYAFVNLVSSSEAQRVLQLLDGFEGFSAAPLDVSWSEPHQGLQVQLARYRNSPIMHASVPERFRPRLFREGVLQPFPAPTVELRAPRSRASGARS